MRLRIGLKNEKPERSLHNEWLLLGHTVCVRQIFCGNQQTERKNYFGNCSYFFVFLNKLYFYDMVSLPWSWLRKKKILTLNASFINTNLKGNVWRNVFFFFKHRSGNSDYKCSRVYNLRAVVMNCRVCDSPLGRATQADNTEQWFNNMVRSMVWLQQFKRRR